MLAIVTYPEHGHGSAPNEPLEILESHSVLVDDYKRLTIDGKAFDLNFADKGHVRNLGLFGEVVEGERKGEHDLTAWLETSETMLAAAAVLAAFKDGTSGQCAYGL